MSYESTFDPFGWRTLTGVVNLMRGPNRVLQELLFSDHVTVPTDDIELSYLTSGRTMAPFVKVNGAAIMVPGHADSYTTIKPANIRISRPFSPYSLLNTRRAGSPIFVNSGTQRSQMNAHIARDLEFVNNMVDNRIEWMAAQALTGELTYAVQGGDVFNVNYQRSATHDITLDTNTNWDNADKTKPRPLDVTDDVKDLLSEEGLTATDAICGANARAALRELAQTDNLKYMKTDSGISAGSLSFVSQYNRDGLIFLGEIGGIRFWHYNRSAVELDGTSTKLIRDDYVEFFDTSAASQRTMYFGAIPDWSAIEQGSLQTERFSKSWMKDDPSVRMYLIHSRPMPACRLPNATVSVKVTNVSG